MPALAIRQDCSAEELRRLARHEPDRRAAMRLLAVAHALDGVSRAEAARLAGMERQALRDAVRRYHADGPEGLHDRPRSGRPEGLTPGQQAALKAWVLRGSNPERDQVSAWRLIDIEVPPTGTAFRFALNRNKLRQARRRKPSRSRAQPRDSPRPNRQGLSASPTPCRRRARRSRPSDFPRCPRLRACASPWPRPACAIAGGLTCCWSSLPPAPRSRAF